MRKEKSENTVDFGERGKYDRRNKINDLTGKEWVYFTNSVWITGYSPTSKDNVGLEYRKIHPSPKPPGLIKDIIEFFTKANSLIFDPFAGSGTLGLAATNLNRYFFLTEKEPKYVNRMKEDLVKSDSLFSSQKKQPKFINLDDFILSTKRKI